MNQGLEVVGLYRPRGGYSLVGAVELIRSTVEHSRNRPIPKLLVNAMGMTGVSIPTLVDRFLAAEEWAQEAQGMVAVALIVPREYIHLQKFGVPVAAHFAMKLDVLSSEIDGFAWISNLTDSR